MAGLAEPLPGRHNIECGAHMRTGWQTLTISTFMRYSLCRWGMAFRPGLYSMLRTPYSGGQQKVCAPKSASSFGPLQYDSFFPKQKLFSCGWVDGSLGLARRGWGARCLDATNGPHRSGPIGHGHPLSVGLAAAHPHSNGAIAQYCVQYNRVLLCGSTQSLPPPVGNRRPALCINMQCSAEANKWDCDHSIAFHAPRKCHIGSVIGSVGSKRLLVPCRKSRGVKGAGSLTPLTCGGDLRSDTDCHH